jgi:hypothetical protein
MGWVGMRNVVSTTAFNACPLPQRVLLSPAAGADGGVGVAGLRTFEKKGGLQTQLLRRGSDRETGSDASRFACASACRARV